MDAEKEAVKQQLLRERPRSGKSLFQELAGEACSKLTSRASEMTGGPKEEENVGFDGRDR
jgi:hypothetical protein